GEQQRVSDNGLGLGGMVVNEGGGYVHLPHLTVLNRRRIDRPSSPEKSGRSWYSSNENHLMS
ncbi:MAG TPA: hypothetical protein P5244_06980, partial [Syntrophales bacterium]|nr:hypothetical protein [Syntrophales bacterium]